MIDAYAAVHQIATGAGSPYDASIEWRPDQCSISCDAGQSVDIHLEARDVTDASASDSRTIILDCP